MLRQIESYLVTYKKDPLNRGRALWDVLTALRGPDTENDDLKTCTTAAIRGTAFPKLVGCTANIAATILSASYFNRDAVYGSNVERHFRSHINSAAFALGLD